MLGRTWRHVVQNCKRGIEVEKSSAASVNRWWDQAPNPDERQHEAGLFLGSSEAGIPVDIAQLFSDLRDVGIYHGPAFQNLISARAAESERNVRSAIFPSPSHRAVAEIENTRCTQPP